MVLRNDYGYIYDDGTAAFSMGGDWPGPDTCLATEHDYVQVDGERLLYCRKCGATQPLP